MSEQSASASSNAISKRLQILGDDEIETLYGLPHFTPEEQAEYFSLSPQDLAAIKPLHGLNSQIYAILQLGYFRARYRFFIFPFSAVNADVKYIQAQYFPTFEVADYEPAKNTRLKHQKIILALCNYQQCDDTARQTLLAKAQQAVKVCGKPIYIFRELLRYLASERLVVPGYSFLQDIVGQSIGTEQDRIATRVKRQLSPTDTDTLNQLVEDAPGLYEITQLKREPRGFSLNEIKLEISRCEQIQGLYNLTKTLLLELEISRESIKYYASLVSFYSVFRLKQLSQDVVHVYLLCFIHHRYQQAHDNLLNSLIHKVKKYVEESKATAKERVYEYRVEGNHNLQKAGQILKFFTADDIPENTPFREVKAQAFDILDRQKLAFVADHIATEATFDEIAFQWAHVDTLAQQFKCNLRPIVQAVEFASSPGHASVIEALQFLKAAAQKGRPLSQYRSDDFPIECIPAATKRYLYASNDDGGQLLPDRYEFLIYRLLRNGLDSGDIFCRDSVRFRSFEDDLLSEKQWKAKAELIAATGLATLKQPIQAHLADLEQQLEDRLTRVNQRLSAGKNEHFELKQRGTTTHWSLTSPGIRDSANHPMFSALKKVNLSSVLHFVNQRCPFTDELVHILGRYTKNTADERVLIAALMAWGTNMGIGQMAETSDIDYHTLADASDNFLRPETLEAANDLVCNATYQLPIFSQYDVGEVLHSSSDGQKFESQIQTINSRHSPKYFGLKKGIVSYTLVANHIPVSARIIGANEHESHYVFDLLFNNTTDIQPTVHSTDTHGTNQVNFALLHLFGYEFAPRYKDIYGTVSRSLYGFQHPSKYGEAILNPIRKINQKLILAEWDNIQRIMVSLALKTTTQSIIVSKLSAYARKNKTRQALWEYDNIVSSLYLLDYVDRLPLRQNVQQVLNRGESYHQLRRVISYANFGKLRFKTEYEQQIWGECARLLTNCIIYYNMVILSNLFTHSERQQDVDRMAMLGLVSPVAWQHLIFHGRYEFYTAPELIDMEAILQQLMHRPIQ